MSLRLLADTPLRGWGWFLLGLATGALLGLAIGCHAPTPPPPPAIGSAVISWTNGNPGSPVCPAAPDCISGYQVLDLTGNFTSPQLPATETSYTLTGTVGSHQVQVYATHQGQASAVLVLSETVAVE